VRAIFAREGEAAFRAHERDALFALEDELQAGAVVATGGGACADPVARAWMQQHGTLVWLDLPLEAIERRVPRDGSRPLFGDRAALDALYQERRGDYASALVRVDADAPSPEHVARNVAQELRERERT
jgi:shikimate kinase